MRAGEGWLLLSLVPGCFCDPWDERTCLLLWRGGACSGLRGKLSTLLPLQPVNWVGGLGAGRGASLSLALLTSMRPPRAAGDQSALLLVPGSICQQQPLPSLQQLGVLMVSIPTSELEVTVCPLRGAEQEPPHNNNHAKPLRSFCVCSQQRGLSQGHHLMPTRPRATLVLAPPALS